MNHVAFQKMVHDETKNTQYGSKEKLRYSNPTCEEDLEPLQRDV